jgi:hypothetical protein
VRPKRRGTIATFQWGANSSEPSSGGGAGAAGGASGGGSGAVGGVDGAGSETGRGACGGRRRGDLRRSLGFSPCAQLLSPSGLCEKQDAAPSGDPPATALCPRRRGGWTAFRACRGAGARLVTRGRDRAGLAIRGRPTSAGSGGGSGGFSSVGTSCNASSPPKTTAAPFQPARQRTRNPIALQAAGAPSSPPSSHRKRDPGGSATGSGPASSCHSDARGGRGGSDGASRSGHRRVTPLPRSGIDVPPPQAVVGSSGPSPASRTRRVGSSGPPPAPLPYATASRNSAMSFSCSSTQSPGLREKMISFRCCARSRRSSGSIVSAR